jgi:hypothetical protein
MTTILAAPSRQSFNPGPFGTLLLINRAANTIKSWRPLQAAEKLKTEGAAGFNLLIEGKIARPLGPGRRPLIVNQVQIRERLAKAFANPAGIYLFQPLKAVACPRQSAAKCQAIRVNPRAPPPPTASILYESSNQKLVP